MKATVKEGLKGFSGKLDGAIYHYHPRIPIYGQRNLRFYHEYYPH